MGAAAGLVGVCVMSVGSTGSAWADDYFYLVNNGDQPLTGTSENIVDGSCLVNGLMASEQSFTLDAGGLYNAQLSAPCGFPPRGVGYSATLGSDNYAAAAGPITFKALDPTVGGPSFQCYVGTGDSDVGLDGDMSWPAMDWPIAEVDGYNCTVTNYWTPATVAGQGTASVTAANKSAAAVSKTPLHVRFWSNVAKVRGRYASIPVTQHGFLRQSALDRVVISGHGSTKARVSVVKGKPGFVKVKLDKALAKALAAKTELRVKVKVGHVDGTPGTGDKATIVLKG